MRDYLLIYLNGQRQRITGRDCFRSLTEYLREVRGLVGTKVVCSEGDCGSCTVLIGRPCGRSLVYRPVDACIQFLHQLDGAHVVTVEGLGQHGILTPVQEALVRCHGSQCGFCTPGFVVAMTGLLEHGAPWGEKLLRDGLTGNLCRCTGYVPIIQAGMELETECVRHMNELYRAEPMLHEFGAVADEAFEVVGERQRLYGPTSLSEAMALVARCPDATLVAGATDIGVRVNKRHLVPQVIVDLNRVSELEGVQVVRDGERQVLVCGARATWTEIEQVCRTACPEFHQILTVFGAPQIRHVGTIGGNLINASPIADSLPLLLAMDAQLELRSTRGPRQVNVNDFYLGYKQCDLQPGELLVEIRIPLPTDDEALGLYKVSRRRDLDIATFTAAVAMTRNDGCIQAVRIALGAVGPTVIRATQTEQLLAGKPFHEATMRMAGDCLVEEIAPISDVRGSSDYRYQLARNILVKFYYEQSQKMMVSP